MEKLKQKLLTLNIFKDNKYLNYYCKLITANLTTIKEAGITQQHHIIPRSYFKLMNLPVDNKKHNIVNLKLKDHIKAHWFLMKASANNIIKGQNAAAIRYMCNQFDIKQIDTLDLEEVYKQDTLCKAALMTKRHKTGWGCHYKKVICIETGQIYNSIKEAGVAVNIWKANISAVLSHKVHTAAGYHWAYLDDKKEIERLNYIVKNNIDEHKEKRKVLNIETNEVFNSLADAANAYNLKKTNICGCCRGKCKTAGGYHWKYLEEADK